MLYFSDAGKFGLAHGLGKLTHDAKNDVRTLPAGDQSWPFFIILLYFVTEILCLVILRV